MRISRATRNLVLLAVVVVIVVGGAFFEPDLLSELSSVAGIDARKIWSKPYFHLGDLPVTPVFVLKAFLFLILLAVFTRLMRRFVRQTVLAHTLLDEGQKYAIERATGYVVFALGLLVGLETTGLNLSSLAFLGGAVGIVIGFGLQNISNNFVSGLILLVERPVKVGDRIEVGNLNGDVTRIGARSTWIRTNDNVVIIVPNSDFISNRVTNWTANDRQVQTPLRLKSDLYFTIFRRFREEGIEIPFPQRDLHLKSVASAVPRELLAG